MWPPGTHLGRTAGGVAYATGKLPGLTPNWGPRLLLAHGAGFCKEMWAPTLDELTVRPALASATEWLTLDFSGHGSSVEQPPPPATWDQYHSDNVKEVLSELGWQALKSDGVLAVGHSMGGAVLATIEMQSPGTFDHTVVIEPPMFPRWMAAIVSVLGKTGTNALANAAAKRRSVWPSRQAVREHVAVRIGAGWDPRALRSWVDAGFREEADSTIALRCAPATEARMLTCPGVSLTELSRAYTERADKATLASPKKRFTLVTCEMSTFTPMGIPGSGQLYYRHCVAPAFPGGAREIMLRDGATHLVPLEQPHTMATMIADHMALAAA